MKSAFIYIAAVVVAFAYQPVAAQDPSTAAAERARLANQRIEAEARRRAEEERALQEAESLETTEPAAAVAASQIPAVSGTAATPAPSPGAASRSASGERAELSLVLEQLRTLGELKDAGYVDDEEFERIKQRIIDGGL